MRPRHLIPEPAALKAQAGSRGRKLTEEEAAGNKSSRRTGNTQRKEDRRSRGETVNERSLN
jgi:hypothetical protein